MSDNLRNNNIWIVIAAFNEADVIKEVIESLLTFVDSVVVVNDNSSDRTSTIASQAGAIVLDHIENLGQGAALQTGIDYALLRGADYIVTFDGDGQHNPYDVANMYESIVNSGAEIALGSRFLGEIRNIKISRWILLKLAVKFTQFTTTLKVTDTHNGLRVFTREGAKKIKITQNGMAHASEILSQIQKMKIKYIEVPVTITYSKYSIEKGQKFSGALKIIIDLISGELIK